MPMKNRSYKYAGHRAVSLSADHDATSVQTLGIELPVNVLIVDDEPNNLTVIETILNDPGYRFVRAESADEALLALINNEFAVIILDIQMPITSGLELAQILKSRKITRYVPIIFLTAYFNEDRDVLRGYSTGAVDYLTKPINSDIFRSKVAVFADLFRKTRALANLNLAMEAEILQRREVEENLQQAKEKLELRVIERTASLTELLNEKEILLREIHHRVKNNMQIVSSLLSLQSQRLPELQAKFLRETQGRIQAMALVHEKLYQSNDLTQVDMVAYTNSLLQPIIHAYSSPATYVKLVQNIASLSMSIDIAIPCGLILNELVSNSLKHAFQERATGEIVVELNKDADQLNLCVRDNGVGFRGSIDEYEPLTLGLRLVRLLTGQLQGQLEIRQKEGTEFCIHFPAVNTSS